MEFYCDNKRHMVCVPYSKSNLHIMAYTLKLNRCWFHKTHYDMPKLRIDELTSHCKVVSTRAIVAIIKSGPQGH